MSCGDEHVRILPRKVSCQLRTTGQWQGWLAWARFERTTRSTCKCQSYKYRRSTKCSEYKDNEVTHHISAGRKNSRWDLPHVSRLVPAATRPRRCYSHSIYPLWHGWKRFDLHKATSELIRVFNLLYFIACRGNHQEILGGTNGNILRTIVRPSCHRWHSWSSVENQRQRSGRVQRCPHEQRRVSALDPGSAVEVSVGVAHREQPLPKKEDWKRCLRSSWEPIVMEKIFGMGCSQNCYPLRAKSISIRRWHSGQ